MGTGGRSCLYSEITGKASSNCPLLPGPHLRVNSCHAMPCKRERLAKPAFLVSSPGGTLEVMIHSSVRQKGRAFASQLPPGFKLTLRGEEETPAAPCFQAGAKNPARVTRLCANRACQTLHLNKLLLCKRGKPRHGQGEEATGLGPCGKSVSGPDPMHHAPLSPVYGNTILLSRSHQRSCQSPSPSHASTWSSFALNSFLTKAERLWEPARLAQD